MDNVSTLLDAARDFVTEDQFNVEAVLSLLTKLLAGDAGLQARGAIRHALLVTASSHDRGSSRIATARYALHRVIVLLEAESDRNKDYVTSPHVTARPPTAI